MLKQQDSVQYGNHIWIKDGYLAKKGYQEDVVNYLNAELSNLEFSSPDAAQIVNSWVANKTNGKIDKEYNFTRSFLFLIKFKSNQKLKRYKEHL